MKKIKPLSLEFTVDSYELFTINGSCKIIIKGKKIGRPSQRISLHQKNLQITDVVIVRHDKKGDFVQDISRINHLPTQDQVRIHTKDMLYPGFYSITANYAFRQLRPVGIDDIESIFANSQLIRQYFPSIDEPEDIRNAQLAFGPLPKSA